MTSAVAIHEAIAAPAGAGARRKLGDFVRVLRDNGFIAGLAETSDALTVLNSPASLTPSRLRPALRALFCSNKADWEKFDEIFDAFWLGRGIDGIRIDTAQLFTTGVVPPVFGALITAAGFPVAFAVCALFPLVALPLVPVHADPLRANDRH